MYINKGDHSKSSVEQQAKTINRIGQLGQMAHTLIRNKDLFRPTVTPTKEANDVNIIF